MTTWANGSETKEHVLHDCLYILMSNNPESTRSIFTMLEEPRQFRHVTSLCLSEWPSSWMIQDNKKDQKFTFAQLAQLGVNSQQLYDWSSPIDIIEMYQLYLDQLLLSNDQSLSNSVFYNCTRPRFGPQCQYAFHSELVNDFTSLYEFIHTRYALIEYKPTEFSCYEHIACNLGSTRLCLDWNNICDGIVQCIDGIDEKDCWQMEINACKSDEYRCRNGQCIPLIFFDDHIFAAECLDQSDRKEKRHGNLSVQQSYEYRRPNFINEEVILFNDTSYQRSDSFSPNRRYYYVRQMITHQNSTNFDPCYSALFCRLSFFGFDTIGCAARCPISPLIKCPWPVIINQTCIDSDMYYLPPFPIVFGHIYLAYSKSYLVQSSTWTNVPEYICYNERLCDNFNSSQIFIRFKNTTCRRIQDILPYVITNSDSTLLIAHYIRSISIHLSKCNTILYPSTISCDNRTMYQCFNSTKCIAKVRIFDNYHDCDFGDDEDMKQNVLINEICYKESSSTHYLCPNTKKCISRKLIRNFECDCGYLDTERLVCPDEDMGTMSIREIISFPIICNGFHDLNPIIIDGKNYTDETECDHWSCNNTYTRCNGYWDCRDGSDEVDCYPLLANLNCSSLSFLCISPITRSFICLSMDKGNDGHIDCLGGTDEPQLCRYNTRIYDYGFSCKNRTTLTPICFERNQLCDQLTREPCANYEMSKLCDMNFPKNMFTSGYCDQDQLHDFTEIEQRICYLYRFTPTPKISHFTLDLITASSYDKPYPLLNTKQMNASLVLKCHHGIPLQVYFDASNDVSHIRCLCLPNYYGSACQYQNQRVSLTMKLASFSDSWQTQFMLIVSLVDDSDERIIHSYEQLTYLPIQHCQTTFDIYLLYANRPKNKSRKYSIQIDIYERLSLYYRGSLLIDIPFQFLPVQRIASSLKIPPKNDPMKNCYLEKCIYGECIRYFNDSKERTFCRCQKGWTGPFCTIKFDCTCSTDSLCHGISANNRSICVCRLNKWGPRCLLFDQTCQRENPCQNNGTCVSIDQHVSPGKTFICICQNEFHGKQCQLTSHEIILSFSDSLNLPSTMLIYFIEVKQQQTPEIGLSFKKIPINRNPVTIYWSKMFHVSFVELSVNRYYLISIQRINNVSIKIQKQIKPDDYCPHVRELFDEKWVQLHLIRRIKYFHIPCRNHSRKLSCFYDDDYFCLCTEFHQERQANCFPFNYTSRHDCSGRSQCENGAQCLQDSSTCPQTSICICPACFYGSQCQFTSNGHSISLDAIIGYHIQPHVSLIDQPKIVQTSLVLAMIIFVIGLINGIFSLITFKNVDKNAAGCGIYLLASSLTTISITILFLIKFILLMMTHMTLMTNRSFLIIHCKSMDYMIRIGLNMDQWFNACIAFERARIIIKGVRFKKKQSIYIAKWTIVILFILTMTTNIIDPLHQRLIEENNNDEQRIWCVLTYSSNVQLFSIILNIFHFSFPFMINLMSASTIIILGVRSKSSTTGNQTYRKNFKNQFQLHRHLFISSFFLFILAVPRLVFMFSRGCMKNATDSWWFLMGYFISFFPPMLNFIIFVVPSKVYTQKFRNTIFCYHQAVRRHFRLI